MIEIVAQEVFGTPYMTQSAEVELQDRTYCSRAMGVNVNVEDYRGATQEEKDAHDKMTEGLSNEFNI